MKISTKDWQGEEMGRTHHSQDFWPKGLLLKGMVTFAAIYFHWLRLWTQDKSVLRIQSQHRIQPGVWHKFISLPKIKLKKKIKQQ